MIVENTILKILKYNFFCMSKMLFLFSKYKKIKTPTHVEKEVAIGIIRKPNLLNKLTLIITFNNTMKDET